MIIGNRRCDHEFVIIAPVFLIRSLISTAGGTRLLDGGWLNYTCGTDVLCVIYFLLLRFYSAIRDFAHCFFMLGYNSLLLQYYTVAISLYISMKTFRTSLLLVVASGRDFVT